MISAASKRRVCSYDIAAVPREGYVLAEEKGEMYFSNATLFLSMGGAFSN